MTNNGNISDARLLILVTSFMRYIRLLHDKRNKSKQILNNVDFQDRKSWFVFIIISLVIQNVDS